MTSLFDAYEGAGIPQRAVQREHGFQQTAFLFTRRCLPGWPVWSIDCGWPGETKRDHAMRVNRKKRGIFPGYPDLWVLWARVITFETKADRGRLSDDQLARRDELIRAGHHWFGPITTLEQIEASLLSLGIVLAATTGVVVPVPQVGTRREANWAKLHDPLPNMVPNENS